ncbi:hypothetical protein BDF19DRAFT_431934 [Syncephalis fuscata]|nr:hypothetical protein BDF19DRAFT_431934 [Syncephalis fuscata]
MPILNPQQEWELLQHLEHYPGRLPVQAARLRRRLHLRRVRRGLGVRNFDLDTWVTRHLRSGQAAEPLPTRQEIAQRGANSDDLTNYQLTSTLYRNSFEYRLLGRSSASLTTEEPWISTYIGRKLRPFIWRDYESRPPRLQLLLDIHCRATVDNDTDHNSDAYILGSIDFCYFQKCHLSQVNSLLELLFWPGIDMTEALLYPDFSVIALYKRIVVGCAFMTPEAYVTYVGVAPGWERANIGRFMMYHLIQLSGGKDVILHVSANNPAMIMYQQFGFKPEEFIINFYDKYLPEDSRLCKNAFLLRLRR